MHFNLRILSNVIVSTDNDDDDGDIRTDRIEKTILSDSGDHDMRTSVKKSGDQILNKYIICDETVKIKKVNTELAYFLSMK